MAAGKAAGAREGLAEIALQHAGDPDEIARHRRMIEPDRAAEGRHRLRRRRLTEYGGGEIAGQHGHGREDHDRNDEQRDQPEPEPLQYGPEDRIHLFALPSRILPPWFTTPPGAGS